MSPVRRADLSLVLAWRTGALIFSNQPLAEVISEVNRYSLDPIIIADPALGGTAVSGSVRIDRIPEWLQGLQRMLDISIERSPNGLLLKRKSHGDKYPIA